MGLMNLQNKNIIVTGGSLGIGKEAARLCLAAGARVVICSRGEDDLQVALKGFQALGHGSNVAAIKVDVTIEAEVEAALDLMTSRFGDLHGLIHCAGIYGPIGAIVDINPSDWLEAIRVNLFGTFLATRQACIRMKATGGGRIALFSGGGGGAPFPFYTSYASSKIGVVRFTENVALEMKPHGIEINCIAPGFVVTRLHEQTIANGPLPNADFFEKTKSQIASGGVPASVGASAAVFLVSDDSKGITGKFLAAPYDDYMNWPQHIDELEKSDAFTLRRILPRDRGMDWQ